jgi:site-specific DNA-cytosine methylase
MSHWQTMLAIDFDQRAAETYAANFPAVDARCASVADLIDTLPEADVIIGGPPCQSFSLAGKRKGDADERDCTPDFCAAVERIKPRQFLMENVRGLLSFADGAYFGVLYRRLESAGYVAQYRLLDSVSYGVPQFRNRLWMWGIRKDVHAAGARHCWPRPTHAWAPPEPCMFGAALLAGVTVRQACPWIDDECRQLALAEPVLHRKRGRGMLDRSGGRRDERITEPSPTINSAFALGGGGGLFLQAGVSNDQSDLSAEMLAMQKAAPAVGTGSSEDCQGYGEQTAVRGLRSAPKSISVPLIQSHADPARPVDEPGATLRSGGAGHDGCRVRLEYDHGVARPDEPCPTVKAGGNFANGRQGGGSPPQIQVRVVGGGTNPHYKGESRTERDIADEPSTTISCGDAFGNVLPQVQLYRWSDAMLQKHPPASPAPTVLGKFYKGGAEGLLAVTAWRQKGDLWVRRLSPLECARLQSVPDDFRWPSSITKTAAYRIIGNGWASLMAKQMSESLAAADPKSRTVIDLFCGGGLGAIGWHGRGWEYAPERQEVVA